jgi:hypothetical protein
MTKLDVVVSQFLVPLIWAINFENFVLGYHRLNKIGRSHMTQYKPSRDNERDIRFSGTRLAEICSSADRAHPDYCGETGRWNKLSLYRSEAGKYVCRNERLTQWHGEKSQSSVGVCQTLDEVVEFFGGGWLAKALYAEAELDTSVEIT